MPKPPKQSAGLLLFRRSNGTLQFFLVHPGGPFWQRKDAGVWTIPKGEYNEEEEPLAAAQREFTEETSFPSAPPYLPLGTVKQKSGKLVTAWAFEGDCDPANLQSNTCLIQWPPRSGRQLTIPEVDRGAWFSLQEAKHHMREEQHLFLQRLQTLLNAKEPAH